MEAILDHLRDTTKILVIQVRIGSHVTVQQEYFTSAYMRILNRFQGLKKARRSMTAVSSKYMHIDDKIPGLAFQETGEGNRKFQANSRCNLDSIY